MTREKITKRFEVDSWPTEMRATLQKYHDFALEIYDEAPDLQNHSIVVALLMARKNWIKRYLSSHPEIFK